MSIVTGTKINQLLASTDSSGLLFSDWLKKKGYSDQLQKRYRDSGWLTSLSKGVMFRTGSNLSAFSALASCNAQTNTDYRIADQLFGAKIIIDNRVNGYHRNG